MLDLESQKDISKKDISEKDPINIGTVMVALLGCSCLFFWFPKKHNKN